MIALVTGANGFIGSYLAESLLKRGFTVRALVRKNADPRWLQGLEIEFTIGNLADSDFVQKSGKGVKGIDYVFHLGGAIQARSKRDYFETNTEGTRRLLEALAQNEVDLKKFIFVSSQAAGGPSLAGKAVSENDPPHPVSFYGESKLQAEKIVLDFAPQFPVVILRPPTIYGPRETRVFAAFQMMKRGFALAAGFKPKWISFCYVNDLVEAILLAAFQKTPNGRIYNVAGPRPYEWLEFVEAISLALKRPYRIFRIPTPFLFLLGAGGEVYSKLSNRSVLFTWQKVKEFVQNSWVIDGTRIRDELGWRERVTLQEGMAKTAEWYQREGWL